MPSEWGVYISSRNRARVLGKKRVLQTVFCVSICLLFIANGPKMKEKGCSDQNPPAFFTFFPFVIFVVYLPFTLPSSPETTTNKPNSSCLHLLVLTFLVLLQMCKTILSWMMVVETET